VGRVRLLPEPFSLVLGIEAADHLHLRRHRHRGRPGKPEAIRRVVTADGSPRACGPVVLWASATELPTFPRTTISRPAGTGPDRRVPTGPGRR
jgi:hypothetical protein